MSQRKLQRRIEKIMNGLQLYKPDILKSGITIGDIVFGRVILGKKGEGK